MLPKRGVEFVDLLKKNHMRHDWLRAPCIYGMLPANGLLYVAPHQCVCYQGVLMSNFNALAPAGKRPPPPEPESRLTRGPAWGQIEGWPKVSAEDWPVYRHDPRRSGVAATEVPAKLEKKWHAQLRAPLTPPVVAAGLVLVAERDAHTVHALSADTGERVWHVTAGGRVDSPPTVHGSLVLFGSADGRVRCLRLEDGREVWRFMAAPRERYVTAFGQVESAWPVHGSVLVQPDATHAEKRPVAYLTAGRHSFLDGGIRVYGLDPRTGVVLHRNRLEGPRSDPFNTKGGPGNMDGAKSDLLVSDGADLYLFQERFRGDLKRFLPAMKNQRKNAGGERIYPPASERGSTGKRLITTHGFLCDADNEGKYWIYGNRWPGWDRRMRKAGLYGQLFVFDEKTLYGLRVFNRKIRVRMGRNLGKGQQLLARNHGGKKDRFLVKVPMRVRGMLLAGGKLFVAGAPDLVPKEDPLAAIEGRRGGVWQVRSGGDGSRLSQGKLDAVPVFDGLAAARGRLYVSTLDGRVTCLAGEGE
jgi:hypothetical protein